MDLLNQNDNVNAQNLNANAEVFEQSAANQNDHPAELDRNRRVDVAIARTEARQVAMDVRLDRLTQLLERLALRVHNDSAASDQNANFNRHDGQNERQPRNRWDIAPRNNLQQRPPKIDIPTYEYSLDSDPEDHTKRLANMRAAANWDTKGTIDRFILSLTGSALKWYCV